MSPNGSEKSAFDRRSLREKRLGAGFVPLRRAQMLGLALGVPYDAVFDNSGAFSDQVLEDLRRGVAENPDDRDARLNLAVTLAQYGLARESEVEARAVVERWPADADARYLLGNLLADRGWDREAEEHLRKAVSLDPDSPGPAFYLAEFLRERGRTEEALEHYRRAVSCGEVMPCAFGTLEDVLSSLGREQEALGVNDDLIARTGEDPETLISRCWHLIRLGRSQDARLVHGRLKSMKLEEGQATEVEELGSRLGG